jgi:hypothetical protein
MGMDVPGFRRGRVALASAIVALGAAGTAAAFQALPSGGQVNDDLAKGIDKTKGVSGEDPTNADVVGGALVAGAPAVPWAIFRAHAMPGKDQIFVRSFIKIGAWKTQGTGTAGGSSSSSPTFSGSLNFDQHQDGEAPAIDFAGTGRTVPWATWYEDTTGGSFGANNIFASRFDNPSGEWLFAGQGRGNGGTNSVAVPSLNIHTNRSAENPSVAGGATNTANPPVPWVTWQEVGAASSSSPQQIFTSKAVKPTSGTTCPLDGTNPAKPAGGAAINGFCWQQVGIDRVSSDPTMNVDPTRDGIEPDIAFTGTGDTVPWVVWYETSTADTPHTSGLGLQNNEMVFAAKATSNTTTADGQFQWTAVGSLLSGLLDTSGSTHHLGLCAENTTNEKQCSLNKDPTADAEDPRVASGTMTAGNPTSPWVAWDETNGGIKKIFVSRLVTTPAPAHFELANNGQPISLDSNPATRPDITFSGNTPYVSWREDIGGGVTKGFFGHFVNPSNPTFVLDASNVPLAPTGTGSGQADVREPISSSCTANPFNLDGAGCQGSPVGTPFFLFTNTVSGSLLGLFADAYQPGVPVTGSAGAITTSGATVAATVNPGGAPARVSFQFGTTTAYGQFTTSRLLGVSNTATAFTGALLGLPSGTTIHYRAVAQTDFGTVTGGDRTFNTASPPPGIGSASIGKAKVSGKGVNAKASCKGASGARCQLTFTLTTRRHGKTVKIGSARLTLTAGHSHTERVSLNGTGKGILSHVHKLKATLKVIQSLTHGTRTVSTQGVTFKRR